MNPAVIETCRKWNLDKVIPALRHHLPPMMAGEASFSELAHRAIQDAVADFPNNAEIRHWEECARVIDAPDTLRALLSVVLQVEPEAVSDLDQSAARAMASYQIMNSIQELRILDKCARDTEVYEGVLSLCRLHVVPKSLLINIDEDTAHLHLAASVTVENRWLFVNGRECVPVVFHDLIRVSLEGIDLNGRRIAPLRPFGPWEHFSGGSEAMT